MAIELVKHNKSAIFIGFASAIITILLGRRISSLVAKLFITDRSARILKLFIYPIKSLPGIEVKYLNVTSTGMQYESFHDRSFILLNSHKNMITQRTVSKLSLIKTSLHDDEIWLDTPGFETLKISHNIDVSRNEIIDFKVWGQDTKGYDCGESVDQWFSRFLNAPTKLVKFDANMPHRKTWVVQDDKLHQSAEYPIVYQDGSPCLLINQWSIDDLNNRLDRSSKVSYRNFRPNILLQAGDAFDEDRWTNVRIGEINFSNVKLCTRCTLTTVIPDQGVKHSGGEPFRTMKTFRVKNDLKHLYEDKPIFGINLVAHDEGRITLDDPLAID